MEEDGLVREISMLLQVLGSATLSIRKQRNDNKCHCFAKWRDATAIAMMRHSTGILTSLRSSMPLKQLATAGRFDRLLITHLTFGFVWSTTNNRS